MPDRELSELLEDRHYDVIGGDRIVIGIEVPFPRQRASGKYLSCIERLKRVHLARGQYVMCWQLGVIKAYGEGPDHWMQLPLPAVEAKEDRWKNWVV